MPEFSYLHLLSELDVPVQRAGVWLHYAMPSREHGWKLHVSSIQVEATRLLQRVIPKLRRYDVPFKIADSANILGLLNEGLLGETQVGKFITIYADELCAERQSDLVKDLVEQTTGFQGPRVVTDAHIGGTIYCRYGEFRPKKHRNRLGLFESLPEVRALVDYRVPFRIPEGVTGADRYGVADISEEVLSIVGPGFLPVRTLAARAKGRTYLALDLREQERVRKIVIKEGRAGCMSDAQGRDIRHRLSHQAEVQSALQGRVHTPSVEAIFTHNGNAYLALELIEGFDLRALAGTTFRARSAASRSELLSFLASVALEVTALHKSGVVHRDLSPNNIRIAGGKAVLMDLELSHRLDDPTPPFQQGTVGYVSPQQLTGKPPATSDDVYSFGAVVAALLTGFPAHVLPVGAPDLGARLARLSGANEQLCNFAAACLSVDPHKRPTMSTVHAALIEGHCANSPPADPPRADPATLRTVAEGGVRWLLSGARRDERSGMWLSPALESSHVSHAALVADWRLYRSANRGIAGVMYVMAKLWRYGLVREQRIADAVNRATDWLLAHHDTPDDQMPGLHFGEAGVAAAICEGIAAGLIERGPWTAPYLSQVFASPPDWPDLTHGAAGQGIGALICGMLLGDQSLQKAAGPYAVYLIEHQSQEGSWVLPPGVEAMRDKAYTGSAHGAAGIVNFLAAYGAVAQDSQALAAAKRGADWLLDEARTTATATGLSWTLHPETNESWAWWCHGAPGIAQAFLWLYRATGDAAYAGTAKACLRTIPKGVRAANLSQCHGLAGLAELMLEGYAFLGDEELYERGLRIAADIADLAEPDGDGYAWKVESLYSHDVDLMTGCAGVIHMLARASCADRTYFGLPLQLSILPKTFA